MAEIISFITYHAYKNRIKRAAMQKVGEPPLPTGHNHIDWKHLAISLEKSLLWAWISNKSLEKVLRFDMKKEVVK